MSKDLFYKNAFGILGLDGSATDREINRRAKEMLRLIEIEEEPTYSTDIPMVISQRDKKTIEKAEQLLLNPEKKIIATFFWFSVKDATDNKIVKKLIAEEYREAIELLNAKIASHPNDYLAIKNRAVLLSLLVTVEVNNKKYLKNSIRDWSVIVESEKQWKDFWKLFKLNNPNVDDSLLTNFRKKVVPMLSDFYAEIYIEDEDYVGYSIFSNTFKEYGPYLKEKVLYPIFDTVNDAVQILSRIEEIPITYIGENPIVVSGMYKEITKNVKKIDESTDMIYSLGENIWTDGKVTTIRNDAVAAIRKVLYKISTAIEFPSVEDSRLMKRLIELEKQLAASTYESERVDKDAIIVEQNKYMALLNRAMQKNQNRMVFYYANKVLETEERPSERAKIERTATIANMAVARGIGDNRFIEEEAFSSKPEVRVRHVVSNKEEPIVKSTDDGLTSVLIVIFIIMGFVFGFILMSLLL